MFVGGKNDTLQNYRLQQFALRSLDFGVGPPDERSHPIWCGRPTSGLTISRQEHNICPLK